MKQAGQRRTLDFFIERKFKPENVRAELVKYGFVSGNYEQIIVTWGATVEAQTRAMAHGIHVWDFRDLLLEIAETKRNHKTYYTDDTARTIQLFAMALAGRKSDKSQ